MRYTIFGTETRSRYRYEDLRDLLFGAGRGHADGRAVGVYSYGCLQFALHVVRYSIRVLNPDGAKAALDDVLAKALVSVPGMWSLRAASR